MLAMIKHPTRTAYGGNNLDVMLSLGPPDSPGLDVMRRAQHSLAIVPAVF